MTRKRSKYRPKPVISDPLSLIRPASKESREMLMARFRSALESIARGEHPGEADWRDLSDAINTLETLTLQMRRLDEGQMMPLINAAIAAMVGAANRYKAGQRMGMDGPGLQAMRDVLDVYEQCLEGLTEREMAEAQRITQEKLHALLRAKHPGREVVSL